jgi:hypothetical protein
VGAYGTGGSGRFVHAEKHNFGSRRGLTQFLRRIKSVHNRHRQIHNHNVGEQFRNLGQRLPAVHGFAADLKLRVSGQQNAQAYTDDLVIVNDKHTCSFRHAPKHF